MTDSRSVGKHRGHDDSTLSPLFIITLLSLEHCSDNNKGLSSFTRSLFTPNEGLVLTPCKANIVSSTLTLRGERNCFPVWYLDLLLNSKHTLLLELDASLLKSALAQTFHSVSFSASVNLSVTIRN